MDTLELVVEFWGALGEDTAAMAHIRRLLIYFYSLFLLWLMMLEMLKPIMTKSHFRGFLEFHLMSFPMVVLGAFAYKILGVSNNALLMWSVLPHLLFLSVLLVISLISWKRAAVSNSASTFKG